MAGALWLGMSMQTILVTSEDVRLLREFNEAIEALMKLGDRNLRLAAVALDAEQRRPVGTAGTAEAVHPRDSRSERCAAVSATVRRWTRGSVTAEE